MWDQLLAFLLHFGVLLFFGICAFVTRAMYVSNQKKKRFYKEREEKRMVEETKKDIMMYPVITMTREEFERLPSGDQVNQEFVDGAAFGTRFRLDIKRAPDSLLIGIIVPPDQISAILAGAMSRPRFNRYRVQLVEEPKFVCQSSSM